MVLMFSFFAWTKRKMVLMLTGCMICFLGRLWSSSWFKLGFVCEPVQKLSWRTFLICFGIRIQWWAASTKAPYMGRSTVCREWVSLVSKYKPSRFSQKLTFFMFDQAYKQKYEHLKYKIYFNRSTIKNSLIMYLFNIVHVEVFHHFWLNSTRFDFWFRNRGTPSVLTYCFVCIPGLKFDQLNIRGILQNIYH
jgi:hypothetical protein